MDRHVKDPFVNLTLGCGLRSRSSIKLLEAYQKFSNRLKRKGKNNAKTINFFISFIFFQAIYLTAPGLTHKFIYLVAIRMSSTFCA